jgi:hypothetical protein
MTMSRKVLLVYVISVLIYIGFFFLLPSEAGTAEKYKVSETGLQLLRLSVAIPLILIWFAAFYGYDIFKRYSEGIHADADGRAFGHIANGVGVLAVSMPINSIINQIVGYLTRQSADLTPVLVTASRYIVLLLYVLAFILIFQGSKQLAAMRKDDGGGKKPDYLSILIASALGISHAYLVLISPEGQAAASGSAQAAYYLPDPVVILTRVIPYAILWFIGFRALSNINSFQAGTDGIIYKKTLPLLSRGLMSVILVSVSLQFLTALTPAITALPLKPLLGIVYLLILVMAAGYLCIAAGAKKLQRIETA